MRTRANEAKRRKMRQDSEAWNENLKKIVECANTLNDPSLYTIIYKPPLQADGSGRQKDRAPGYRFQNSILYVKDLSQVQTTIRQWAAFAENMTKDQTEMNLLSKGKPEASIPPEFRPPKLEGEVLEIRVYENQASTSWKVAEGEVQDRIGNYMEKLDHELVFPHKPNQRTRKAAIEGFLSEQADTWLGILLARDYPQLARKYFGPALPPSMIPDDHPDLDDTFRALLEEEAVDHEDEEIKHYCRISNKLRDYFDILAVEPEQGGPARIRLMHASRKVFIRKSDKTTKVIPLARNGVFLISAASIDTSTIYMPYQPSGNWKRRQPNRNTLFRLGNYEFCTEAANPVEASDISKS